MEYSFIYDSSRMSGEKCYTIDEKYFGSPAIPFYVLFQQEDVYLEADVYGNAVFCRLDGTELFRDKADGQGHCFFEVHCTVNDGVISVRFPIQKVIDHYPNCDGEYDRYSYITKENVVINCRPCE